MDEPTGERWLPVVGFEGLYEVSDLGRVRSLPRKYVPKVKIRKPQTVDGGYQQIVLSSKGTPHPRSVHRMVAEAFLGPRSPGMEILHGDDDKTNNALSNLRYGTRRENIDEAVARDRCAFGERNGQTRVTAQIVAEIRAARAAGERGAALAARYGLSKAQISRIGCGLHWAREPGSTPRR